MEKNIANRIADPLFGILIVVITINVLIAAIIDYTLIKSESIVPERNPFLGQKSSSSLAWIRKACLKSDLRKDFA